MLLKGNFDPRRFNSTTLAAEIESSVSSFPLTADAGASALAALGMTQDDARIALVDYCQRAIDNMATKGIIS